MGIPVAKQKEIFNAFDRLGREFGAIEGTGIGLVITKQLVEAMGGNISFISFEDKGSTFMVDFSLCEPSDAPEIKNITINLDDHKQAKNLVLYVEDNLVNARLVQHIFARRLADLQLHHAITAEIGIEFALAELPSLILMDINLPGMDGYEALKLLKADPRTAHIPVVALTANAMKGDEIKGLASGFSEYMTKPLDINQFLKIVDRYLIDIKK